MSPRQRAESSPPPAPGATSQVPGPGGPDGAAQDSTPGAAGGANASPAPTHAPEPPEHVLRALQGWQRRLVDAGGPNTLLWFDDVPAGTLDLTTAHPGGVSMLMAGRATRLSDLVREPSAFAEAHRRAEAIRHKTVELAQERGLSAGFMAIGMATWEAPGARRAPLAPVLLRGCSLTPTDPSMRDYDIDLSPAVEINPVLVHYLASEQGIDIDPEAVAALAHSARRFDPLPVFRELTRMCRGVPGFRIADRKIVAPFSYAKLPLVADLVAHGPTLAASPLVGRLADAARADEMGTPIAPAVDAPRAATAAQDGAQDLLVLGTDAAQREVVAAVRAGRDVALDAPAGTGATQTVAATVAALVGDGKRVLVVSEAATPLDDLTTRLTDVGLDRILARVGEGGLDRGQLAAAVRESVELVAGRPGRDPDATEVVEGLYARRDRLDAHRHALHSRREPWGVSVFDGLAALARLTRPRRPPTSRVRLDGDVLRRLDVPRMHRVSELLTAAAAAGAWSEERRKDPWAAARITDETARARAAELTHDFAHGRLDDDRAALDELLTSCGLAPAQVPGDWAVGITLLEGVRDTLRVLHPEVFGVGLVPFLGATGDADYRRDNDLRQSWWARMRLRRRTRDFVRDGAAIDDLHAALSRAHSQTVTWRRLSGGSSTPRVPAGLEAARSRWDALDADLTWLAQRLTPTDEGGDLHGTQVPDLRGRLARLAGRGDRLDVLPRVVPLLDEIGAMGLGPLADDLATRRVAGEFVAAEMEFVWWRSVLDEVARADEVIGGHDAAALRRDVGDYATLDAACQRAGVDVTLSRHARGIQAALTAHRDQLRLVHSEASRGGGYLPVDRLVQAAGDLVLAARPVWLLSPLVVASALPPEPLFDVVVVQDAGRLDPAHVVSAFARARQVLLVGDSRQQLPRPFTTSVPRPGQDRPAASGPSLLDVLRPALTARELRHHYRSYDERLVDFAGEHFYDGRVQALPGAGAAGTQAVRLVVVDPGDDGAGAFGPDADRALPDLRDIEAEKVVDLVVQHAVMRPTESLAVAALSGAHAERLAARLRARLDAEHDPDVVDFFAQGRTEPVIVVPLEDLQTHSRDALVLGVGVEPMSVTHPEPLGALSRDGGERALAAALLVARRRLTVVSAVTPEELEGTLRSRGATLLRELLEHAARQGLPQLRERAETRVDFRADAPAATGAPPAADSALEQAPSRPESDPVLAEFAVRLRQEGLVVRERYGEGPEPIDLVVEDPHHVGHAVVAVESDGPRYAAAADTRERELVRPGRLRALGWEYVAVCSADIFADPARDVARVLDAVRAADARSWSTRPRRSRAGRGGGQLGAAQLGGGPVAGRGPGASTPAGQFEGVALDAVAPEPPPEPPTSPTQPSASSASPTSPVTPADSSRAATQEAPGPVESAPDRPASPPEDPASSSARPGDDARARSAARSSRATGARTSGARPARPTGARRGRRA